jgi:hypothetical protein
MILVKLWGGLGNQLFQYAFALYLSEKRGETPLFFYEKSKEKKLDIHYYNTNIETIDNKELQKFNFYSSNILLYRFKRKLIRTFPFLSQKILVENSPAFLTRIANRYSLFDGYWQSYRYLETIEDKIRKDFTLKKNSIPNTEIYESILNETSVSVHIRRGDYLTSKNAKLYESIPLDYYLRSIDLLTQKLDSPIFYIFSNDLKWVKENLEIPNNIALNFVDNSQFQDVAIADFTMMSNCKHHIIANSTFSWWSAWLNPSKDKIIIAPKKWYVGKMNKTTIDLIPREWIRL